MSQRDDEDNEGERKWTGGFNMAWILMIQQCLKHLGIENPEEAKVAWIGERVLAVEALREVCEEYGDNDWSDDLNLSDVIAKHLHRRLAAATEEDEDEG